MLFQNKFSKDEGDNFTQLQAQVNEVKGVMTENIEKVLQRGERLEDLIDKTEDLEQSVSRDHKSSLNCHESYYKGIAYY